MSDFRIIFTRPEDGGVSVIVPAPGVTPADAAKAVPAGLAYDVVPVEQIPADRTFRGAWEKSGAAVQHNLGKCKAIAHDKRRAARAAEFAPLDVEATIPAKAQQAEAARAAIRAKYDALQTQIEGAASVEQLRGIVQSL
jgi:hypothetical protein